jgi:hypothetical protein
MRGTNSMEQKSSWEANSRSACSEITPNLLNSKIRYRAQKARHWSLPWGRWIQSPSPTHYFFKIRFNIILPSMLRFLKRSLTFRFPDYNFLCTSHHCHTCYMSRPSYPHWFHYSNNIWWYSGEAWYLLAVAKFTRTSLLYSLHRRTAAGKFNHFAAAVHLLGWTESFCVFQMKSQSFFKYIYNI